MSLSEIHVLRSHLRPTESELRVGPRNLHLNELFSGSDGC